MYEAFTFDFLLNRMLNRVPDNIDKREGSVIYDAIAPAAAELAQLYVELDINYNLSFADTATGDELTRRVAEFGVNRKVATKSHREGKFFGNSDIPVDIPIGSRWSIDDLNYVAISQITTGVYVLECETVGIVGNQSFGSLLPISFVAGLTRAELTAVLIPGSDEEIDDVLRPRYYESVNEPSFGGNVSDYKQKVNAMDGVGGSKIFPVWDGGGTVKAVLIASDWGEPSSILVNGVQAAVDPVANSGKGYGTAPIGHKVTIEGVRSATMNVAATITLESGVSVGQVQGPIESVIESYLLGLRKSWADQTELTVRVAMIDVAILSVPGVIDVDGTTLNAVASNLLLDSDEIPLLGTVIINE